MLFFAIVALTTSDVHAAAANTLKFTDTYTQKVVYYPYYGYYDVIDTGKFTITAKVSLAGININTFDRKTPLYIYVGNFDWYCTLGDDPAYAPGKTSATILVRTEEPDYYNRTYQYLQIKLKWSVKQMQVTITGITPDALPPIWADDYLYNYDNPTVNDITDAYIEFGDNVKVFFDPVYIKGKATVKYNKKYGGDVSNVKLTGTGTGIFVAEEPF
jgi:hypothetical protein